MSFFQSLILDKYEKSIRMEEEIKTRNKFKENVSKKEVMPIKTFKKERRILFFQNFLINVTTDIYANI